MLGKQEQFFSSKESQDGRIENEPDKQEEIVDKIEVKKTLEQELEELTKEVKGFALKEQLNEKSEHAEEISRFSKEKMGFLVKTRNYHASQCRQQRCRDLA